MSLRDRIASVPYKLRIGDVMREYLSEQDNGFVSLRCVRDVFEQHILYGQTLQYPEWLSPYISRLETLEPKDRLAFHAPPQHGKTTVTMAWMVLLAASPGTRGRTHWYVTYNTERAMEVCNEFCRWCRCCGIDAKRRMNVVSLKVSGRLTRFAFLSIKTGATGKTCDGHCVIDDPLSKTNAFSRVEKDTAWSTYLSDLTVRIQGAIVVMATRWCMDDLTGRLLDGKYGYEYIRIPAMSDTEDDPLGRSVGTALWPERWDEEFLAQQKLDPNTWHPLYQGTPLASAEPLVSQPARISLDEWVVMKREAKQPRWSYGMDAAYGGKDSSCIARMWVDTSLEPGSRKYYLVSARRATNAPFSQGGWAKVFGEFVDEEPADVLWDYAFTERTLVGQQLQREYIPSLQMRQARGNVHQRYQDMLRLWNQGRIVVVGDDPVLGVLVDKIVLLHPDSHVGTDDLQAVGCAYDLLKDVKPRQQVVKRRGPGRLDSASRAV